MSVFGVILIRIFRHLDWIRKDMPYSVRMRENADKNYSEYRHLLRSGNWRVIMYFDVYIGRCYISNIWCFYRQDYCFLDKHQLKHLSLLGIHSWYVNNFNISYCLCARVSFQLVLILLTPLHGVLVPVLYDALVFVTWNLLDSTYVFVFSQDDSMLRVI